MDEAAPGNRLQDTSTCSIPGHQGTDRAAEKVQYSLSAEGSKVTPITVRILIDSPGVILDDHEAETPCSAQCAQAASHRRRDHGGAHPDRVQPPRAGGHLRHRHNAAQGVLNLNHLKAGGVRVSEVKLVEGGMTEAFDIDALMQRNHAEAMQVVRQKGSVYLRVERDSFVVCDEDAEWSPSEENKEEDDDDAEIVPNFGLVEKRMECLCWIWKGSDAN